MPSINLHDQAFLNLFSGWLLEPESRPAFTDIALRLDDMLLDPLRYILTTNDGLVNNYDNLPSNVSSTAEFIYENPFTQSTAGSLEWNRTNGTAAGGPYSNLSDAVFVDGVTEYDDVVGPQMDTFNKVRELCKLLVEYRMQLSTNFSYKPLYLKKCQVEHQRCSNQGTVQQRITLTANQVTTSVLCLLAQAPSHHQHIR